MKARRILGFGTMRSERRAGFVALVVLMLIALMTAAGLHAGTPAAGTVPAGKDVKNPFEGKPEAVKEGDKIFDEKCSECHMDGTGGAGPNLTDDSWIYGGSDAEVFETIAFGRKGGMPSWKRELGEDNIWKVIAYIRSIHRK
jgi:cytochrome c oxidase cbb3-type subunit III